MLRPYRKFWTFKTLFSQSLIMTNNFSDVEVKTQQSLENVDFTQSGELALTDLNNQMSSPPLDNMSPWEFAHYIAVENWLTEYKPKPDATNLEKVRGSLEAFHHLCKVEAWETASKILFLQPNLPNTQELHKQLGTWGCYREQIELYSRLLNKFNPDLDCILLHGLGWGYCYLGKPNSAITYHQQLLDIACKTHNRKAEVQALRGLGRVYAWYLGQDRTALQYHQEQLEIAREIGDLEEEGYALDELAHVYCRLGQYQKSLKYAQEGLIIAREIGNQEMEIEISSGIGSTYIFRGQHHKGIPPLLQALDITKKNNNRRQEWSTLYHLYACYCSLGQYQLAIEYGDKALEIIREIGDRYGEGRTLGLLAIAYSLSGQYDLAIGYFQSALRLNHQIGNQQLEGFNLVNLAYCYGCLKQHEEAISYSQEAMRIACETHHNELQGLALATFGNSYWHQGQYIRGLLLVGKSLLVNPPWQSNNGQIVVKKAIEIIGKTLKRLLNLVERANSAIS